MFATFCMIFESIFKKIITPATQDSIGNDPIHVSNVWISGNYLNYQLRFYGGNKTHFINLVKDALKQDPSGTTIALELRHNKEGDTGKTPLDAVVCFNLSSLQQSGKTSQKITVINNDFDSKTITQQFTYTYGSK